VQFSQAAAACIQGTQHIYTAEHNHFAGQWPVLCCCKAKPSPIPTSSFRTSVSRKTLTPAVPGHRCRLKKRGSCVLISDANRAWAPKAATLLLGQQWRVLSSYRRLPLQP